MESPKISAENDQVISSMWPALQFRLSQIFSSSSFVGMGLGVIQKITGLSHFFSKGFINLESKVAPHEDTLFRCASITKSFTCIMMLQLRDKGLLPSLDSYVSQYLPQAKKLKLSQVSRPLTFRELASHASGLPKEGDFDRWQEEDMQDTATILSSLEREAPFASFTQFHYSNIGFILLGLALERIAEEPFIDYVQQHILKPLGMTSSTFEYNQESNKEREATGYFKNQKPTPSGSYRGCAACGGLLTTIADLGKYMRFLMHTHSLEYQEVLHPASVRELLAPVMMYWSNKPPLCGSLNTYAYSLGFMLSDFEGEPIISHSGGTWGFVSHILWLPRFGVGLGVFANTEAKGIAEVVKVALSLLVPALRSKIKMKAIKVPSKEDCEGRLKIYQHKIGARLRVSLPRQDEHVVRLDFYDRNGEKTKGIGVIERIRKETEENKDIPLCERMFIINPEEGGDVEGELFKFSPETNEEGTPKWVKRGHAYFYLSE